MPEYKTRCASLWNLIITLWFLYVLIGTSDVGGGGMRIYAFLALGGLVVGLAALFHGIVLLSDIRSGPPHAAGRGFKRLFLKEILFLLIAGLSLFTQFLMPIRHKMSEAPLRRYVEEIQEGVVSLPLERSKRVGLFLIKEAESFQNGAVVRLITSESGWDDAGFVYSPDGRPPLLGEDSYDHLRGPWWTWVRRW